MSKRNLYKPAPSQTPPPVGRKSLVQGHLISTDPHSLLSNGSPSEPKPSPKSQETLTPQARRSLDYRSGDFATKSEQHPQSRQMSQTIVTSPAKVKPSSSLSLSETEEEPKKLQVQTSEPTLNQPSVLIVDASQRHSSFKDNEVPIKTSYVKSPVKVVCHTSRTDTSGIQYAHAGKIKVPVKAVPAVNVLQGSVSNINESQSSSSPPASEDGSLSTIAGSPVDPRSKAVETRVVRETNNPRSYVSFIDDDGSVTGSDIILKADQSLEQSQKHIGQPKFDDTAISSIAGDSILSSIGAEETKQKKKKTRVVKSKYMTSAMSRRGQKSDTTKSGDSRHGISTTNKTTSECFKTKKADTKRSSKVLSKKPQKKIEFSRKNDGARVPPFTSTPALGIHPVIADTSSIIPVITPAPYRSRPYEDVVLLTPSYFTPSKEQHQKKKTNTKSKVAPSQPSKDESQDVPHTKDVKKETAAPNRKSKQPTGDISQLQLDMQYARLCQWRFIRSKYEHTFEKQEKEAQEQMYSMWQCNDQLRKKRCELQIELEAKQKREEIDGQLELQLSPLRSIDENSSRLLPDHHDLFEGVDTTRHHVTVKDMLLPENEDDLLAAFHSCENTLGEITTLLQDDKTKVLSFSNEMQVLADTVLEEEKEHDRCTELLAAASTLTTQEKSLQAELLSRKEYQ